MSGNDIRIEKAKSALLDVFASWVAESPDDIAFLDKQISDFNACNAARQNILLAPFCD
jgi:hypothetical protein